jgi:hypothetical protein
LHCTLVGNGIGGVGSKAAQPAGGHGSLHSCPVDLGVKEEEHG